MKELDRQQNIGDSTGFTPSEVGGSICLSSDGTSPTLTSLGGKDIEKGLRKLLEDLALKIIKEEYEKYKQSSPDLY